jgi:hypothetical protein
MRRNNPRKKATFSNTIDSRPETVIHTVRDEIIEGVIQENQANVRGAATAPQVCELNQNNSTRRIK